MRRAIVILAAVLAGWPLMAAGQQELRLADGQWQAAPAPAKGTPEGELALMRHHIEQDKASKALGLAEAFAKRWPQSERQDEALFWAGQAEMAKGDYWAAFNWFERLIDRYPTSDFYERALHREAAIADAFLAGKKRQWLGVFRIGAEPEGLEIHERIAERAPATRLAAESLMKIANYHFQHEQWAEAADYYAQYGQLFRGRYDSAEAQFRHALAVYRSSHGPKFDDTPFLEAEQLFRLYEAHYPRQAADKGVGQYLASIQAARAQKDYNTARFYARTGHRQAAALYFREVIRLYPDSPQAAASRLSLLELELAAPAEAPMPPPAPLSESAEPVEPATAPAEVAP